MIAVFMLDPKLDLNQKRYKRLGIIFWAYITTWIFLFLIAQVDLSNEGRGMASALSLGVLAIATWSYIITIGQLAYEARKNSSLWMLAAFVFPILGVLGTYMRMKTIAIINGWDNSPSKPKRSKPNEYLKNISSEMPILDRMEKYHMVLNLAVAEYVLSKLESTPEFKTLPEPKLMKVVNSIVNLMFSRSNPIADESLISLEKITELANHYLEENPLLLEVVVQSRRTIATIRFGRSGESDIAADYAYQLMESHGKDFPAAPNPNNYPALMDSFIDSLPEASRSSTLAMKQKLLTA